jgi:hypothetical protein
MSRGQHSFKQRDLTRALKAAKAAGLTAYRIEIDDSGKPVVIVGSGVDKPAANDVGSWDDVVAELERQ